MKWNTSSKGNKPLKVGVTGGIGSGKTVVCRVFAQLGIPVFWADQEAKKLMNQHPEVKLALIGWFGSDIYLPDGTVDRKKMAQIIFNDKIALENVNHLVHPKVREEFSRWSGLQVAPYVIQEAAILFETGQESRFDHVIVVTAPEEERVERIIRRDGLSRDKVMDRMKNQWPDQLKLAKADDHIICDDQHLIIPQVIKIHEKLKARWQNLENG